MKRSHWLRSGVLAACLACGAAAWAQAPAPVEMELGATRENLTNNQSDWRSVYFEASRTFRPRQTLYGGVRETRRFNQDDTEAYGGLYYPLADTWTGMVEATASPTHNVLPNYSIFGQLQKEFARGLIAGLGARRTEYPGSDVRAGIAALEYYWSDFRAAYTLYSSSLEGAGAAPAHRFQLNRYYGDRSTIGIAYTTGREVENVGAPRGLVSSDVRDWTISGRHWFTREWGVSWDLLTHEQGDFYRRRGGRLGLRHRF